MKKLLLLFTIMAVGLASAWAQSVGNTFTYTNMGFRITGLNPNTVTLVSIPAPANLQNGICAIPGTALYNDNNNTVEFSVTAIGDGVCQDRTDLTFVTIPSSVTSIGENAFKGCTNSGFEIVFNNHVSGVITVGNSAFKGCTSLSNIDLSSATSIGASAFDGCTSLGAAPLHGVAPTINLGSATTIGDHAFYNCTSLKYIDLHSATTIGAYAFYGCNNLLTLTRSTTNTALSLTTIGYNAFEGCTNLRASTDYPLDLSHVTSIGSYAFQGCTRLEVINLPAITSIGGYAFYGCNSIASVTLSPFPTTIGYYAFSLGGSTSNSNNHPENTTLTSIDLSHVTSIGVGAFFNCQGLTGAIDLSSVTTPSTSTTSSIGNYAFWQCNKITSVTLGSGVTSIGSRTFYQCTRLETVSVAAPVIAIRESAFYGCTALTSINLHSAAFGTSAFNGCTALTSIDLSSVTSVGYKAFSGCSGLTCAINLSSATTIGENAFLDCSNIPSVTIGKSVTSIGTEAFSGCNGLSTVYDYSNLPITRGYRGIPQTARVVKVLTDNRGNFKAVSEYSVDSIYYTRSYEQGNRSTLCLPFKPAAVSPSGVMKYYVASSFDGSTITFNEVSFDRLVANTPYMVEWPASKTSQEFKFCAGSTTIIRSRTADTTVDLGNNGKFIGTMARTCMNSSNYGYKNGYFVQSADGTNEDPADHAHVNPFRAYFQITPSGSQGFAMPTELSVRFNTAEDNVGIDSVEPQQSNIRYSNDVYDMMGRMVRKNAESLDGLRKGVYIWKGEKKVVF